MGKFKDIINQETPTLVDVYATWCGPCKAMPPILKEVKNQLEDQVRVLKIDIDKNQAFAQKHHIQGVPTLLLYQNGEIQWRTSGVQPAHLIIEQIKQLIK